MFFPLSRRVVPFASHLLLGQKKHGTCRKLALRRGSLERRLPAGKGGVGAIVTMRLAKRGRDRALESGAAFRPSLIYRAFATGILNVQYERLTPISWEASACSTVCGAVAVLGVLRKR